MFKNLEQVLVYIDNYKLISGIKVYNHNNDKLVVIHNLSFGMYYRFIKGKKIIEYSLRIYNNLIILKDSEYYGIYRHLANLGVL